jgi:thiol-disulfide isomerase/thioredoxin
VPGELLLGGLLLAAVFAAAGVAKLADLDGSRKAVAGFGVPPRLASPLGTFLPLVELATAVLLAVGALVGGTAAVRSGAFAALVLISVFCAAIAASVARGQAPDCHCFGQLHSAPAGKRTLARNGILLIVAAFVASAGDAGWTVAAAAVVVALLGLLPRAKRLEASADALPHEAPAPDFELSSLDGGAVSLAALRARGRPVLLVFTDPNCGPCIALAPEVADWQTRYANDVTIAVVERGEGSHAAPDGHGRRDVLVERGREVSGAYRAEGTPSAVLISRDGLIASDVAGGAPAIQALLGRTLQGLDRDEPAPFARRELLVRAATALAGIGAVLSVPDWARAMEVAVRCRYERCGDRCCPKNARCRPRGGRRVCVCPDRREACGDRCCPPTFECRTFLRGRRRVRRCVCPVGRVPCGGRCVRTRSDPLNCGRCGVRCPIGTSCVAGTCVSGDGSGTGPGGSPPCQCPRGQACCEGECKDLNTDEQHCGRCKQPCREGETCCEGRCLRLDNDPQNCGQCGKRCAENEVCGEGECRRRCPPGGRACKGSCIDVATDSRNCGGCSRSCNGATDTGECCNGNCCHYNAQTCCPGGCVNTALDGNCGGCGIVCGPNSYCRFGICTCPIPPCP